MSSRAAGVCTSNGPPSPRRNTRNPACTPVTTPRTRTRGSSGASAVKRLISSTRRSGRPKGSAAGGRSTRISSRDGTYRSNPTHCRRLFTIGPATPRARTRASRRWRGGSRPGVQGTMSVKRPAVVPSSMLSRSGASAPSGPTAGGSPPSPAGTNRFAATERMMPRSSIQRPSLAPPSSSSMPAGNASGSGAIPDTLTRGGAPASPSIAGVYRPGAALPCTSTRRPLRTSAASRLGTPAAIATPAGPSCTKVSPVAGS
jgi:hypothetical protein